MSVVAPALTWSLLAASLVIGLAALVRMAGPAGSPDDLTGVIRLPDLLAKTIVTLFVLATLVFLVDLVRRLRLPRRGEEAELPPEKEQVPTWLRTLRQVLSLVNVVVLAYLLWRGAIPLVELGFGLGGGSGAGALPQEPPVDAPPLITWTFGIVALVAALGALALALSVAFSDRLAQWWKEPPADPAPSPLEAAVEESLEDLRAEPDPRRAIIRCYARFERVAAARGLERKPWHTPMEFMREALPRLPVPRGAVPTLTGLFELARFSHRALGASERDRALGALDEIKAAIEAPGADALAR